MSYLMDIRRQISLHRYWKYDEVSFIEVRISNMQHEIAASPNNLFVSWGKLNLDWWHDMPPSSLLDHGPIDEFYICKLLNKSGN